MNKLITLAFFCLFSALANAEVQLQVESQQVNMDEPFQISLTQNDPPATGAGIPNLTPLRKDFLILGTEQSVNYAIINGQTQSSRTWLITLRAKKAGILTIPAINVGNEQTMPLTVNVSASAATTTNPSANDATDSQSNDMMLITTVSDDSPYVNQQITYKVSLYNSKQILDANYQGPKVENALLIPLGNGKRYQTQKNGRAYVVDEQIYAIFPQKSGPLTITSPVLNALIYNFEPQRVSITDKATTLNVQPIPAKYSGGEWLPAKQITVSEEYESTEQTLNQGATLVRNITIKGVGIPAQLLPTLKFAETPAFNVYPEKGKENNQVVQNELVSSREIKITYLFNQSGTVTIPAVKLPWFNTTTGQEEFATLAPRSMKINPSATANNTPPQSVTEDKSTPTSTAASNAEPVTESNYWPWYLASFFAVAWFITLGLWGWQKHKPNVEKRSYHKALHELHKACMQANPHAARDALLHWARLHWPDASLLNLSGLNQLVHEATLKKQIHILSQVLYQPTEKSMWRGDELWRSVEGYKPSRTQHAAKAEVLPPMNPGGS